MNATGATFKLLSSRVYLKGQKLNSLGLRFSNLDSGSAHEYKTSVSKTIRKPPLAEAKTALEKQKKIKYGEKQRFTIIWWMEFFHPAMWHVALGWHDIEIARWQHPTMWHVALGWHAIEIGQTSAILEF